MKRRTLNKYSKLHGFSFCNKVLWCWAQTDAKICRKQRKRDGDTRTHRQKMNNWRLKKKTVERNKKGKTKCDSTALQFVHPKYLKILESLFAKHFCLNSKLFHLLRIFAVQWECQYRLTKSVCVNVTSPMSAG